MSSFVPESWYVDCLHINCFSLCYMRNNMEISSFSFGWMLDWSSVFIFFSWNKLQIYVLLVQYYCRAVFWQLQFHIAKRFYNNLLWVAESGFIMYLQLCSHMSNTTKMLWQATCTLNLVLLKGTNNHWIKTKYLASIIFCDLHRECGEERYAPM